MSSDKVLVKNYKNSYDMILNILLFIIYINYATKQVFKSIGYIISWFFFLLVFILSELYNFQNVC